MISDEDFIKYPDLWMVRPCHFYKDEYDECKCLPSRFHQYFIFGETKDCSSWIKDYDRCKEFKHNPNEKTYKELVDSEKQRRYSRLMGHYGNTVWKKRSEPPANWNTPLPDWLQKKYEHTYLAYKAAEWTQQQNSETSSETQTS